MMMLPSSWKAAAGAGCQQGRQSWQVGVASSQILSLSVCFHLAFKSSPFKPVFWEPQKRNWGGCGHGVGRPGKNRRCNQARLWAHPAVWEEQIQQVWTQRLWRVCWFQRDALTTGVECWWLAAYRSPLRFFMIDESEVFDQACFKESAQVAMTKKPRMQPEL